MSVKVENRPENRFTTLQEFEKLCNETIKTYKLFVQDSVASNTFKLFKTQIMNALISGRTELLTANALNVYNNETFKRRIEHLTNFQHEVNTLKSIFEIITNFEAIDNDTRLKNIYLQLDKVLAMSRRMQASTIERHDKGEAQVKKEYREARMKDFYHPEANVKQNNQDPSVLSFKDPMGVREAINI